MSDNALIEMRSQETRGCSESAQRDTHRHGPGAASRDRSRIARNGSVCVAVSRRSGRVGKANPPICFVSVQNAYGMPNLRRTRGRTRRVVPFFGCENLHAYSGQETWTVKEDGSANAGEQVFVRSKLRH